MRKTLTGPGSFRIALAFLVYLAHTGPLQLGVFAVYVFFTLSGFWISRLWTAKYSRSSRAWPIFVVSRCWRLWPVFIASSALSWALVFLALHGFAPFGISWTPMAGHDLHQIISNTVIFGYASLPFAAQISRPMWSLDIEAQFYLVAPLVLLLLGRGRVMAVLIVLVSLALLLFTKFYVLPRYLIFFVIGIVAEKSRWAPGGRVAVAALSGVVIVIAMLAVIPATHGIVLQPRGDDAGTGIYRYNHPFSAILAFLILPWTIFTTRQRGCRYDGVLADLSFVFYAFHYPFLRYFNVTGCAGRLVPSFLCTAATCAIVCYFDTRIQHARSAWVARAVKA